VRSDPIVNRLVADLLRPDPQRRYRISLPCPHCGKVATWDERWPYRADANGQWWVSQDCWYGCRKVYRVLWDIVQEYGIPWRKQPFPDYQPPDPGPPAAEPMTTPTAAQLLVGENWHQAWGAYCSALSHWQRTIPRTEPAPEWDYERWVAR
jgi:hypothetical protein